MVETFIKRSGLEVDFDSNKIKNAIIKIVPSESESKIETLLNVVLDKLSKFSNINADICNDVIDKTLIDYGYVDEINSTKIFRSNKRQKTDNIKVKLKANKELNITDSILLINNDNLTTSLWDRSKIINQLKTIDAKITNTIANDIAKSVERSILSLNNNSISTTLIRELVNSELESRGYKNNLVDSDNYTISKQFINNLLNNRNKENSNVTSNNPEAVSSSISDIILKKWALDNIFSKEVKRAHQSSAIHLHDLNSPHRVYCSAHSLEYIKKYGLKGLINLNSESRPAKSASVLTGHFNTFLASMQANYAGALGCELCHFYAVFLKNMSDSEIYQIAQELVYNCAQNAYSRAGNQTLFIDFNIHTSVPHYLKNVPAVCPGGKYRIVIDGHEEDLVEKTENNLMSLYTQSGECVLKEKNTSGQYDIFDERIITYKNFEKETKRFTRALLEVFRDGDANGRPFFFPKCDFHISDETFSDPEQYALYQFATEVSAHNGSVYFVFDRDSVTLSACCRLRTTVTDNYVLYHPESLRFCGFQNVSINIPQAAYRTTRNGEKTFDGLWKEVESTMEIAMMAHIQKKTAVSEFLKEGGPLYQIGKIANDGRPYVDLDNCTYIIGIIGVNDAIRYITGKNMHEDDESYEMGLLLVSKMFLKTKEFSERYNLKVTLEESPAESAAGKLAKSDNILYPESRDIVRGTAENPYYTNSIHFVPEAEMNIVERIRKQSVYHNMIESGAIIHVFSDAERPSAKSIEMIVTNTFRNTQCAQLVISPTYSVCDNCKKIHAGSIDMCPDCHSEDITVFSRIVGYYSIIKKTTNKNTVYGWNSSKLSELEDRKNGEYSI